VRESGDGVARIETTTDELKPKERTSEDTPTTEPEEPLYKSTLRVKLPKPKSVDSIEDAGSFHLNSTETTNNDAETSSEIALDDNKLPVSNDDSWTDVNLNEEGERAPAAPRARDLEGNVHEDIDKQIHMRNPESHHQPQQRHQNRNSQAPQRHLHTVSIM
ncbi:hypothetical protein ACJJTC_006441, partial [Scirpophaga incertulas]